MQTLKSGSHYILYGNIPKESFLELSNLMHETYDISLEFLIPASSQSFTFYKVEEAPLHVFKSFLRSFVGRVRGMFRKRPSSEVIRPKKEKAERKKKKSKTYKGTGTWGKIESIFK